MVKAFNIENLDMDLLMGRWYVIMGRTTPLEKGAVCAEENYSWNASKNRVDIEYKYRKKTLSGPRKSLRQKAWVVDSQRNFHWKVQPIWPLKMDYIFLDVDRENYNWVISGVPNQKYLWVMTRSSKPTSAEMISLTQSLAALDYPTEDLVFIPQA